MYSLAQISIDLLYVLLAFAGIDYSDNSARSSSQFSQNSDQIALQINFETNIRKYSTKISASGMPQCTKALPQKSTRLRRWKLSITP